VLEKVMPRGPDDTLPACVAGKNNCPPEDTGGIWGYSMLLEAREDPKHARHKDAAEWLEDFDPTHFDPAEVNGALAELFGK
jgi:hypothetical protein